VQPVDEVIRSVLEDTRTWAVVGCSPDRSRDSHRIASMLKSRGYRVVPINPSCAELLGERCYPTLADAVTEAGPVDVVDIFRRASEAGRHVDEAIEAGASAVWMQLGVIDRAAAERARAAGLKVVMDRCPAIEMPRLRISGPV
jgi:predicted CoA-binding protein